MMFKLNDPNFISIKGELEACSESSKHEIEIDIHDPHFVSIKEEAIEFEPNVKQINASSARGKRKNYKKIKQEPIEFINANGESSKCYMDVDIPRIQVPHSISIKGEPTHQTDESFALENHSVFSNIKEEERISMKEEPLTCSRLQEQSESSESCENSMENTQIDQTYLPQSDRNIKDVAISDAGLLKPKSKYKKTPEQLAAKAARARMIYRRLMEERGYIYTPEQKQHINEIRKKQYRNRRGETKPRTITDEQRRIKNEREKVRRRVGNLTEEQVEYIRAKRRETYRRKIEEGGENFKAKQKLKNEKRRAAYHRIEEGEHELLMKREIKNHKRRLVYRKQQQERLAEQRKADIERLAAKSLNGSSEVSNMIPGDSRGCSLKLHSQDAHSETAKIQSSSDQIEI